MTSLKDGGDSNCAKENTTTPPLGAISKKWGMVTLGNSKKGKKDEKVANIWRWVTSLRACGGPAALPKKEERDKGFCVGASSTTPPQEEYIEEDVRLQGLKM